MLRASRALLVLPVLGTVTLTPARSIFTTSVALCKPMPSIALSGTNL